MMRLFAALALLALPLPAASSAQAPPAAARTDAIDELRQADRAFEQANEQGHSLRSLEAMFADDITMFVIPVPGFAHGKAEALEHLQKAFGAADAAVSWTPVRFGVSADGRHGFSFGYTEAKNASGARLGKYVAYWVRGAQGWRVALFKIVPREAGAISMAERAPALPDTAAWAAAAARSPDAVSAELAAREKSFSDDAQRIGLGPAFARFGSADAVNAGGETEFVVGNEAIGVLHGSGPSPLNWAADNVLVADSGDLGVTWGLLHRNGATPPGRQATIPFFTIWRKQGPAAPWLYVAE